MSHVLHYPLFEQAGSVNCRKRSVLRISPIGNSTIRWIWEAALRTTGEGSLEHFSSPALA